MEKKVSEVEVPEDLLNAFVTPFSCTNNNEQSSSEKRPRRHASANCAKISNEAEEDETTTNYKEDYRVEFLALLREFLSSPDLPEGFRQWDWKRQRDFIIEKGGRQFGSSPEERLFVFSSLTRPGDCGRSASEKPDWLDKEKFKRGQKFALDHICGLFFSNVLSLFLIFSFKDALKPMIFTEKSHTPYLAFKRYLSTVCRVRNWYTEDPWTEGTAARKDIETVRKMHLTVKGQLSGCTIEEYENATRISKPWCPMRSLILDDFNACCPPETPNLWYYRKLEALPSRILRLNQADMAATQFAFMGMVLLYPRAFGVHDATKEDLDAFCHVWRGLAYLLGVEDEYNFCRGSLEEIKHRCRLFVETFCKPNLTDVTPEWEHMLRCVVEGTNYYVPGLSYNLSMMYLADILGIKMPRLYSTLSIGARVVHFINKIMFYYVMRWKKILALFNKRTNATIDRALRFSQRTHSRLEERSTKTLLDYSIS